LKAATAHKPAHGHGHGHGGKVDFFFLSELRHKGGCCCFEWAVCAPWADGRVLYATGSTIQPQTANMAAYLLP
jgi:hypothetical protein